MHLRVWDTIGLFTTWGPQDGTRWHNDDLEAQAAAAGVKWVAYEVPPCDDQTLARVRGYCRAHRLQFGVWLPEPPAFDLAMIDRVKPGFVVFNDEVTYQDAGPMLDAYRKAHPSLPTAVITDFEGFRHLDGTPDPAAAKPWIDHGVVCLPECYTMPKSGNPNATWPRMAFAAQQLGWAAANTVPCFGVYDGWPLSSYPLGSVSAFSIFEAENMRATDWATLSAHR